MVFASDGATLLGSLTYTNAGEMNGGIAIRSFGGFAIDTITTEPGPAVPSFRQPPQILSAAHGAETSRRCKRKAIFC
jgi:hypothetical protein